MSTTFLFEGLKRPLGRLGVNRRVILRWIIGKFDWRIWIELILLKIRVSGGLF
jgi:hypothetical protein